jgi:type IV pilus assembly protein PilC
LINAGIQLLPALHIIEESCSNKLLNTIIVELQSDLKTGVSFSAALCKHGKYFNELFCSLTQIGEETGKLNLVLTYLAEHQENIERLKRKISKALFYPITVVFIAITVTAVLLIFVVPQFATMFANFGAGLPVYTQILIKAAAILQHNILAIIIFFLTLFIGFKLGLKYSPKFSFLIDKIKLRLPIAGNVFTKAMLNIFCRTLAMTLTAGLPLTRTLPIIGKSINNKLFQSSIFNLEEQIKAGNSFVAALKMNPIFPRRMTQIVAVGEESGDLGLMLEKAAGYYEAEVNHVVENLSNLLEPIIMVILGLLVGGIIIGMYLPIFKLGSVI